MYLSAGEIQLLYDEDSSACACKGLLCDDCFNWIFIPDIAELLVIVATLIAPGCPLQAIVAVDHLDERTILSWPEQTGLHCLWVHEHLALQSRDPEHVQAD